MTRSESAIVLFTLTPEAEGARKPLGLDGSARASAIFATLIEHVASVCSGLPEADLLVATETAIALPAGARELRQRGRDFGESLCLVFEDAFRLGYRRVIVIGNDAPEISRDYLADALRELGPVGEKAVLGPATDGGYNLLGLSAPCAPVFEAMPWGSADVARRTQARLEACGFELTLLRTLEDIDSAQGLVRFFHRIVSAGHRASAALRKLVFQLRRLSAAGAFSTASERRRETASPTGALRLRAPPSPLLATL